MLSIPHLIIIFVVALVVFGPEKLPELARNLGKVLGEFRRATGDLRNTFEGHLQDLERESEQRRIGGATQTAPPAAAAPTAALPEGVVAADAPNASAGAAPADQSTPENLQPNQSEPKPQEISDENVSDGGPRPA
jgi:sec-independent protein translocase protein TatB